MSLFLSKILPLFVYPLGLGILVIVGALLLARRSTWLVRLLLVTAIVGLWIPSMPCVAAWSVSLLERATPSRSIAEVKSADAILLLGGILSQPAPPSADVNLGEAIDRAFMAARLFKSQKAPRIVVLGGNLPWHSGAPESDLVADLLVELGVPRDAIILERESRNTRENAQNAVSIFSERRWQDGLLVTSAMHMPRAIATFGRVGLDVSPVPTDYRATHPYVQSPLDLLPNADALAMTTGAIKEWIGLIYYRARGWA